MQPDTAGRSRRASTPRIRGAASCRRSAGWCATASRRARASGSTAGIVEGGEVSMFYDPMIAKLCAYGPDRADGDRRGCARALDGYRGARRRPQHPVPRGCSGQPALRRRAAVDQLHRRGVWRPVPGHASCPRPSGTSSRPSRWPCGCARPRGPPASAAGCATWRYQPVTAWSVAARRGVARRSTSSSTAMTALTVTVGGHKLHVATRMAARAAAGAGDDRRPVPGGAGRSAARGLRPDATAAPS